MLLACPKCAARHDVDLPTGALGRALRFRCTECAHAFSVTADMFVSATPAASATTVSPTPPIATALPPSTTEVARPQDDTIVRVVAGDDDWRVGSPALLHAWCLEGRVLPEDTGVTGDGRHVGLHSRAELAPFFEAARVLAAVREGRLALGPVGADTSPPEPPRVDAPPQTETPQDGPAIAFAPPDDLAPLEHEVPASPVPPAPYLDPTVGFFEDDAFTDERAHLASALPTEPLDEDRPTTLGPVDEEALAAAAARARATPIPLAELLAGAVAALPREDTHEQEVPAPPPAMVRPSSRTIVPDDLPSMDASPVLHVQDEIAHSREVTVAVPEPAATEDVWSAPPPQPADLPWGKLAAGVAALAVVGVFAMRGTVPPEPEATAPEAAEAPSAAAEVAPTTSAAAAPPATDADVSATPKPEAVKDSAPTTTTPSAPAAPSVVAVTTKPSPPAPAPTSASAAAATTPPATTATRPATTPRPRGPGATVKEGWSAVELGDFPRAKDLFAQAITLGGGSPAFHGRGYANERLGDLNAAVSDYCAALGAAPSDPIRAELEASLRRAKRTCP